MTGDAVRHGSDDLRASSATLTGTGRGDPASAGRRAAALQALVGGDPIVLSSARSGPVAAADQAPRCGRCTRRHDPALPCWRGRYSMSVARAVIAHYGDLCHLCRRPGARSADHLRPRSRWGGDDLGNLRPAHKSCNQRRQDRAAPGWGARLVVVCGPPGAGKTTYVAEHAEAVDVVIDLDALALALMRPGERPATPGAYPAHVRHVAIGAREEAIRRAVRLREAVTVWLVHALPAAAELADYRAAGAEIVALDPGIEVLLDRLAEHPPAALATAARWYAAARPPPAPAGLSSRFRVIDATTDERVSDG